LSRSVNLGVKTALEKLHPKSLRSFMAMARVRDTENLHRPKDLIVSKLFQKQIGLFKRGEVAAAIQPIPINQIGIAILGPVAYHFWPAWAALIGVD
jgi:hypothetical protein